MKSFVEFVAESVATPKSSPKKATEETTGHLPHVGELLYSPHPNKAIEHMKKVHARFKDKHSPNHKTSLKVDGGMSVVVGRHQDGRHFVSYKTGSKKFETHDEIAATGKEHYVREMSPLLDHAKRMNLKSGHAFQADIVHNTTEHKETAKPNAITYKNPKGKHLVLASHSQYSVGHGGELKKTTSHPDIKQLENHTIHAPDLALDKKVKLGISKERSAKVDAHIKAAKKHLTPETTKFAKNLATGKGGHHSKFKAFVDQYNSHAARTSGTRSVEGAKNYVSTFMAKKAQSSSSDKTQKDLHNSLHKSLSDHEHHFTNLFNAHNHINAAKHHILDEFKGHAHKFDIQTHNGEEHEGIVSTIGEKHQTKLVREGPGGFPEKNERNAQSRFGKNKITEAVAAKKGKAFLLSGSFSPYTIGHHEVARKAAEHAKATGHTDFYHGIGSPKNQSPNDPLTHKQKKSIIRLSHKNIAKEHTGMQYHTTSTEHKTPFHQLTHLARSGYTHITMGLGSDQMGGGLKKSIETHIKRHGGIQDITGKVHKVKVDFHQLGGERKEGEMPRHEVLSRLRKGDISVAKAGRLRKAVSSGDTELAHALMPTHMDKPKYFGTIKSAQSKIAKTKKKVVKEGYMSFAEFVSEDIELIPVTRDRDAGKPRKAEVVHKDYGSKTYSSDKVVTRKNHGEIHPGYELHQHSVEVDNTRPSGPQRILKHKFTIVHKASGDIAGEMHARGGKLHPKKGVLLGSKGKALKVSHLEMHPDHSSKKVGASLPVEMYRHLHRKGHAIQSDSVQSHGGAHVWNTMRDDRELKKHMMIHDDDKTDTKQKHAFQTRAYKRPERHIWHQFSRSWSGGRDNPSKVEPEYGVDPDFTRTLILAGKKPKKKMNEAPELDAYIEPSEHEYPDKYNKHFSDSKKQVLDPKHERYVGHRNLGDIHPGYELHRHVVTTHMYGARHGDPTIHSHRYTIVHKKSGDVAGEIDAEAGKIHRKTGKHTPGTGKGLKIQWVGVHSDHSSKKVGKSLAIAAYKHLHGKGHSIKSDTKQSFGGAHVWDKLRHDPDVRDHVKVHDMLSQKATPAHKLDYDRIWQEHPLAQQTTLVLHAKPKKKPAVVSEDIEMADILIKPKSGGLAPRNFEKMVAHKGLKPKRSGKIAKGYTLHTSIDEKNPEFEDHHIVHDATGHVAGEVSTRTSGNDHTVIHTDVHGDHTQKVIGKSLAVLAYKHLAKKKGNLHSSNLQSPGGASIWNRLRKDPKMKGRVFHQTRGKAEVPAHDVPDKKIWATEVAGGISSNSKKIPKSLPPSKHHAAEHENVIGSRLVIRPIKKS